MKAFTFPGDRRVMVVERPVREPGPGEVLIRTRTSAICGTDLHLFRQPADQRAPMADVITGHEAVGEVERVGEGVTQLTKGARVVVYHVGGCGACEACQLRRYKECPHFGEVAMAETRDGANAEFITVPAGQCLPLPEDFSFEDGAVLACNFGTAYGAVKNAEVAPAGTVAVWGMGPVGLCIVMIAKALGQRVIAIEVSPSRCARAERLGAEVIDGQATDVAEQLRSLTNGQGPHAVIDTTGVPAVQEALVPSVRVRGRVVLIGIGHDSTVGPILSVILKQLTIVGSWIYDVEDWSDMLHLIRSGNLDLSQLVEVVASPDEAEEMFRRADLADGAKVVFSW